MDIAEGIAEYLYELMQNGDLTKEQIEHFLEGRKIDLDILNALEKIAGQKLI